MIATIVRSLRAIAGKKRSAIVAIIRKPLFSDRCEIATTAEVWFPYDHNDCWTFFPAALAAIVAITKWKLAKETSMQKAFDFWLEQSGLLARGGGTPLYGLYGDVPLDRVWFLASLS